MADITPAMIKDLRERTGVGVGKCKEALETAKGDMELAIANLRKAGMASAVKKEGRETKEGMIGVAETNDRIAIVEVNAETDFVVKNDMFRSFLHNIAEEAAKTNPSSLDAFMQQKYSKEPSLTIDQFRATMVQTIGENIQVKRILILQKSANNSIGVYSHLNGKIVTFVDIAGSKDEVALAKDIAMHVAAASPEYLSSENIPQNVLDNEKDIARSQVQGKAPQVLEKIVDGKINSFYTTVCLDRQPYIRDDKITVGELVNKKAKETGKHLKLASFARWSVGQA
jgi:elongation factor Ts